ncbi:hypothetical protein BOX15_Mlig021964g1 [Macrostomum lignano]|uniref:CUE domain-containing protein n=2 Tax=Macrostomum lignano TaxID=282301 RepID=A0A267GTR4_9PLAT|nr:hypothetical protein BOX15_Mlig021964g1 [Macrostomum lignano]
MTSLGHRSQSDSGAAAAASSGPRQLDFYEAMSDFQTMFPSLDPQLIECVLRDNNGVVHTTVDSLLRLSESAPGSAALAMSKRRQAAVDSKAEPAIVGSPVAAAAKPDDLPPSYEQALRASQRPAGSGQQERPDKQDRPDRHHTHPPKHSRQGGSGRHGGGIRHGLSSLQPQQQAPPPPPPPPPPASAAAPIAAAAPATGGHHRSHSQPSATTFSSYNFRASAACASSAAAAPAAASSGGSSGYRRWNPPLLGALPDDFLRISTPASGSAGATASTASSAASVTATAGRQGGGRSGGASGRSRSHHHKCSNCGRYHHHHRTGGGGHRSAGSGSGRPRDPTDQLPETPPQQLPRQRPSGVSWQQQQLLQQPQAISPSSSYHSNGLSHQHPQSHSAVYNQILADERLAIALQNEEFLSLLRNDSDFMRTLQRDSSRRTRRLMLTQPAGHWQQQPQPHARSYSQPAPAAAVPSPPAYPMQPPPQPAFPPPPFLPPPPRPSMPVTSIVETGQLVPGGLAPTDGYGADQSPMESSGKSDVGGAASQTGAAGGDDLNSQLRHMGKMSGRRFAEMARKFFGMARQYKQRRQQHLLLHQPQLLTMSAQTESTLNLLENGDFEAEDDGEVNPVVGTCGGGFGGEPLEEETAGEAEAAGGIDRV